MFIVPLTSIPTVPAIGEGQPAARQQGAALQNLPFADVLAEAVKSVEETQAVSSADSFNLALGLTDDLHTTQIDSVKAATAIDFATGLASKAIAAYNEILRMNI